MAQGTVGTVPTIWYCGFSNTKNPFNVVSILTFNSIL